MNRLKGIITVALIACFTFLTASCSTVDEIKEFISQSGIDNEKIKNDTQKSVSNSISVGLLDFDTFNPLLTKSQTVKECMEFVYEPLFELNEKMQAVPILAENYSVSPDGRTIDITLRNDVKWHDGSAFTASDVAYTVKQIRSGVTEYTDVLINTADYLATDEYTFRIVLNYAVPSFVSLMTFPIVKQDTKMTVDTNFVPVGTGPYKYNSQISSGKLMFTAFDEYYKGKANIDSLYAYTVPNIEKYESMFEASEIDLMTGNTVDLSTYTPRGSIKNNEYMTNKMTFVGYNTANELLSGVETRRGLTCLINKEGIVKSTIYSKGIACNIPINPMSIFYYDTNTKFKSDEVLASQHLGNDGWGVDKDGKYVRTANREKQTLVVEILTNSDSYEKVAIAEKIADDFNRFGVITTVNALPYDEYMVKVNMKDYEIMIGEAEIGVNNDLTMLVSSTDNYFSYSNTDLDMLVAQLGMTGDEEQQMELFKQYGDIIVRDMPFTPLFFRENGVLTGSKLKNEIQPSQSRSYRNIETWSVTE